MTTLTYDRDAPLYPAESVATAAGIEASLLRTQVARGMLDLPGDKPQFHQVKAGAARMFSYRSVLRIVLAERIAARTGISLRTAVELAMRFTDEGETIGGWGKPGAPERLPGELFADGTPAVFRIGHTATGERRHDVVRLTEIQERGALDDCFEDVLLIDLDAVVRDTRHRLKI